MAIVHCFIQSYRQVNRGPCPTDSGNYGKMKIGLRENQNNGSFIHCDQKHSGKPDQGVNENKL